jgi:tetratricopeptide (TPR) repeat protein
VAAALGAAHFGCARGPTVLDEAVLLSEKGRDREAIQRLEGYVASHPEAIAERRLLVRLDAAIGDFGACRRAVEDLAARLPPDSPIPWLELGHALELAHRYDVALAMYDRAADVAPRDPSGPRTGGLRAARWGEAELAAARLEEALRRDPRDAAVWHALGLVRLEAGDLAGAQVAYESGLVADPGALENRIGLATLALRRDDARAALAEYDRILRDRPAYADGYLGRSWALVRLGRLDAAEAALDEASRRGADARVVERQRRLVTALRHATATGTTSDRRQ